MSRELFDAVSVRGRCLWTAPPWPPSVRGLSLWTDTQSNWCLLLSFFPSFLSFLLPLSISLALCLFAQLLLFFLILFYYRIWIGARARARASARSDSAVSVGRVSHFNPKPFPFLLGSTSGKIPKQKGLKQSLPFTSMTYNSFPQWMDLSYKDWCTYSVIQNI